MSDGAEIRGRNESTTGTSSDVNFDDSYGSVKVPTVFKIKNVVTSVSCSAYLSSSNALVALLMLLSIARSTFQFMAGPVKFVNKEAVFKPPRRLFIGSDNEDWIIYF